MVGPMFLLSESRQHGTHGTKPHHTLLGSERKFVFIIGSEVRPKSATKNFEHGIIWWSFEESF
jgi:hypothetical protein